MKKVLMKKKKKETATLYIEQIICGVNGAIKCCKS